MELVKREHEVITHCLKDTRTSEVKYSESCDIRHWLIRNALLIGSRLNVNMMAKRVKYWCLVWSFGCVYTT
jgi:hypothetical protein